jgi:hypothetical protein
MGVGGRWLLRALAGNGFCVHPPFMCVSGGGFCGPTMVTALLCGVARGNFCDGRVKFRRGKSCAGVYVGSKVSCHVGWLHVAAGWSLMETG